MNPKSIWIVVGVLVIAIAGYALLFANAEPSAEIPVAERPAASEHDDETDTASGVTVVTLTDAGFTPKTVTIERGQTVRFVNASSRSMWVGSDDHPTHTGYDGTSTREHCADGEATNGTFDQCEATPQGEHWDYAFEKSGTFGYHNHVGASNTGTVIVQ